MATPDRIVSELTFGFWVALLSSPYDARFWRPDRSRALKTSFPAIPKSLRQRQTIYKRYNELRSLRNRVFHHETIWNRVTLDNDLDKLAEAISWISPETHHVCTVVDRTRDVRNHGRENIKQAVARLRLCFWVEVIVITHNRGTRDC
jgi:hypothetical protein